MVQETVEAICHCLIQDPFPSVRIKAAQNLLWICQRADARECIRPCLGQILVSLLALFKEYEFECLAHILGCVVIAFPNDVTDYVPEMSHQIINLFFACIHDDAEELGDS
jgi:hypothetical protein